MYLRLAQIPLWPTREQIDKYIPSSFKQNFLKTRVIVDCTELFCETPTSLELKGHFYSDYKSRNTY